jgi:hypothetical protein
MRKEAKERKINKFCYYLEINIVLITATSSTFKIWKLSAVIRISITVGQQTAAGFGVKGCC